ncbi:phosphoinositide phosphatase SAC2-like isoform X5 [Alnus glutinosa]|nr:phosphoinositide phosphatase SAC2-like isoform X5 [Alnus glutinosa]
MRSLQKNFGDYKKGEYLYKKMFVWNEFLTSEIRNSLSNTLWTVALVHGFFKQVTFSISGRNFKFTLIARRSRFYAGTRYLKRGVNDRGRVANDVETEQIVSEDTAEGYPMQISSVVQFRGSIPLFWSQNTSGFRKFRPEFSLPAEQHNYKATRLHFKNLVRRYGKPIVVLNLLKTRGKKRAEKTLGAAYAKAITAIIDKLQEKNYLRFCRWDLHRHMYYRRAMHELQQLGEFAADTLDLTGIFYCRVTPNLWQEGFLNVSYFDKYNGHCCLEDLFNKDGDNLETKVSAGSVSNGANGNFGAKCTSQNGVLRTNCMDCLDRTNVAQYVYGLAALGRQLHALGFIESPIIDFEDPLAENLMRVYEAMGDTLALQYGGSPAHNKIFANIRGQWRPAIDCQDLITTVQRYYSNAFSDFERQDAINVFLGYFRPQQGKPVPWALDLDQCYTFKRSSFKRSQSDSDILSRSNSTMASTDVVHNQPLSEQVKRSISVLDFMPEIPTQPLSEAQRESTSISEISTPIRSGLLPGRRQEDQSLKSDDIGDNYEHRDASNNLSLFDMGWHSSAGNSFYEADERCLCCEDMVHQTKGLSLGEYSESFVHWVLHGEALFLKMTKD